MDINRIKRILKEHGEMLLGLSLRLSETGQKLEEYEAKAVRQVVATRAEEELDYVILKYVRNGEIDQTLLNDLFPYITSNM
uniref:Uncharacterized protein n=1 Tax=viral metagenome TaxID=1070528 RepID=A0A6M3K8T0_9ZZZZ